MTHIIAVLVVFTFQFLLKAVCCACPGCACALRPRRPLAALRCLFTSIYAQMVWEANVAVYRRGLELIKPGAKCCDIAHELNEVPPPPIPHTHRLSLLALFL